MGDLLQVIHMTMRQIKHPSRRICRTFKYISFDTKGRQEEVAERINTMSVDSLLQSVNSRPSALDGPLDPRNPRNPHHLDRGATSAGIVDKPWPMSGSDFVSVG
jgi:hypothetical protein